MQYKQYGKEKPTQEVSVSTKKARSRVKGRSNKTYQNKVHKVKKRYNTHFQSSQKRKNKNPNRKKLHFCDKYPTFEAYLKTNPIKQSNIR